MKKLLTLLLLLLPISTFAFPGISELESQGFYRKHNGLCKWIDLSSTESEENCWKQQKVDYETTVCNNKLQKVDNTNKIIKVQRQIDELNRELAELQNEYKEVKVCNEAIKSKEVRTMNTTKYIYKIVYKTKVLIKEFVIDSLPNSGASE